MLHSGILAVFLSKRGLPTSTQQLPNARLVAKKRREKTRYRVGMQSTYLQSAEPQSGSALIAAWRSAMAGPDGKHGDCTPRKRSAVI
jgi:hypothetical protein